MSSSALLTKSDNRPSAYSGRSGVCRMFIWTFTPVKRDSAMENSIIVHEFAHGVTNRLTGGGTARCLQTLESGGMGEGWGDMMAKCVFCFLPSTVELRRFTDHWVAAGSSRIARPSRTL